MEPDRLIRIARIITRLNVGGPSQHVALLQRGLDRERFESRLIAGAVPEGEREAGAWSGLVDERIADLVRPVSPLRDRRALRRLRAILGELRPDVVHTHQGKAGLLGRLAAVRAGVPARVHTFHGHTFHSYWSGLRSRAMVALERWLARRTTAIIVQSESQASEIGVALGASVAGKLHVIEPAVDYEWLDATRGDTDALRSELGLGGHRVLAFVGRLAAVKDPHAFLRIVKRVADRVTEPVAAVVAGGGADAAERELHAAAAELGLGERVRWLGYRDDPASIYALADVVVQTSRNEGTPLSLIEAMACGTSIVAYDVGGVADIVGRRAAGAHVVTAGDEEAAALAVTAELADGRSVELRADAVIGIRERFGKGRLVREVEALYESLPSSSS